MVWAYRFVIQGLVGLYHVVLHYIHCIVLFYAILYHIILHGSILHDTILHYYCVQKKQIALRAAAKCAFNELPVIMNPLPLK